MGSGDGRKEVYRNVLYGRGRKCGHASLSGTDMYTELVIVTYAHRTAGRMVFGEGTIRNIIFFF